MNEYVVLRRGDDAGTWIEIGAGRGGTQKDAIRHAVKAAGQSLAVAGTYAAVPVRSWKPITRAVEQVEKERWS